MRTLTSRLIAIAAVVVLGIVGFLSLGVLGSPAGAEATTGLDGVQSFKHVVVLTMENEDAAATFGTGSQVPATYINQLRSQGVFLPNYYGTGHVSLDNYIAMVSGQPGNGLTNTDCLAVNLYVCAQSTLPLGGRHIGDQLDTAGLSWKTYQDGTAQPCVHQAYSLTAGATDPYQGNGNKPNTDGAGADYADRHNPFIYFPNFVGDAGRCAAHQMPYASLAGDLANNALPAFSFITPDTCHDGHDNPCSNGQPGGLTSANLWLSQNVPSLLSYLNAHDGVLIINFDEGGIGTTNVPSVCTNCASLGAGGRTGALVLSCHVAQGATVTTGYDHYSLLRTVEDSFGISEHLNLASLAAPMTDAWAQNPNGCPDSASD